MGLLGCGCGDNGRLEPGGSEILSPTGEGPCLAIRGTAERGAQLYLA